MRDLDAIARSTCTPPWATIRDWVIFACFVQARRFSGALFLAKEHLSELTPLFFRADASERARRLAPTHFSSLTWDQGEAPSECLPRHFQIPMAPASVLRRKLASK